MGQDGPGTTIRKKNKNSGSSQGSCDLYPEEITKIVVPARRTGTTIRKKNKNSGSSQKSWDLYPEEL
jgi:hypothetical protein